VHARARAASVARYAAVQERRERAAARTRGEGTVAGAETRARRVSRRFRLTRSACMASATRGEEGILAGALKARTVTVRQREEERRPLALGCLGPDPTAVAMDDALHGGQPHAGA